MTKDIPVLLCNLAVRGFAPLPSPFFLTPCFSVLSPRETDETHETRICGCGLEDFRKAQPKAICEGRHGFTDCFLPFVPRDGPRTSSDIPWPLSGCRQIQASLGYWPARDRCRAPDRHSSLDRRRGAPGLAQPPSGRRMPFPYPPRTLIQNRAAPCCGPLRRARVKQFRWPGDVRHMLLRSGHDTPAAPAATGAALPDPFLGARGYAIAP